jgi:4-amino-4-deoxy-L-arabinose transferase-like glycosyltransferase
VKIAGSYRNRDVSDLFRMLFIIVVVAGVGLRFTIALIPGNSVVTPWSGGGDMYAYVLLARNIVSGYGYSYAHMPTAFRTPGYPLFLAGTMLLFGKYFLFGARLVQAIAGIGAACLCMRAARILFGRTAGNITLIATLLFPTLVYFSGEILTEGLTSFFVAFLLWTLAEDINEPNWKTAIAVGLALGFGSLVRANISVLGLVALASAWAARSTTKRYREIIFIPICAGIVVAPWIIRNTATFGRPLFSTETGAAILVSLVNPEARLMSGWDKALRNAVGYVVPNDLETNDRQRLAIGSELDMNRECLDASARLWRQMSLSAKVLWVGGKWEAYWLSTDQLLHAGEISRTNRLLHVIAVLFYWGILLLALIGWLHLRTSQSRLSLIVLSYVIIITVFHTPFVMNSRIRAPLADPLLAVLAGGGGAGLLRRKQVTAESLDAFSHGVRTA